MKKIIQDIIVSRKKSAQAPIKQSLPTEKKCGEKNSAKKRMGKLFFIAAFAVFLIIIGTKLVDIFSKVIITISLHTEITPVETVIKAGVDGASTDIKMETMELNFSAGKDLVAEDTRFVETKASGTIIIYNAYGTEPQTLVKNTRFESGSGKIYRIEKTITVPGAITKNGKTTPGSIQATIYADESGENYNAELSDFTIPGFKDDLRYEKFYARSTTAITGGLKGEIPFVGENELKQTREELQNDVRNNLLKKAYARIPDNFLLYENSISVEFSEKQTPEISASEEKIIIKLEISGFLYGYLLPETELSDLLVRKYSEEEQFGKIRITNLKELTFSVIKRDRETGILIFKLAGEAKFVWLLEEEKLKESLIASQKNIESVFKFYPAIDKADVAFKPFWWKFFPDKNSKINIKYAQ